MDELHKRPKLSEPLKDIPISCPITASSFTMLRFQDMACILIRVSYFVCIIIFLNLLFELQAYNIVDM